MTAKAKAKYEMLSSQSGSNCKDIDIGILFHRNDFVFGVSEEGTDSRSGHQLASTHRVHKGALLTRT